MSEVRSSPEKRARRAQVFFKLGNQLRHQGHLGKAIESYGQALIAAPDNTTIQNNLGLTYLQQGNFLRAIRQFKSAIATEPTKDEFHNNLGLAYKKLNRYQEAIECFEQALSINDHAANAMFNLAVCMKDTGCFQDAIHLCERVITIDSDLSSEAQYLLDLMNAQTPDRAPPKYVKRLFDQYAPSFNRHLLRKLKYRLPVHISAAMLELFGDNNTELIVGDLGCGTGIAGPSLRSFASSLIGIDISTISLRFASELHLYDELITKDIIDFLNNDERTFDVLLAADVIIYFGRLEKLVEATTSRLGPDGVFIFSFHPSDSGHSESFHADSSGRFHHQPCYVESTLSKAGLRTVYRKKVFTRMELENPVFCELIGCKKDDGGSTRI